MKSYSKRNAVKLNSVEVKVIPGRRERQEMRIFNTGWLCWISLTEMWPWKGKMTDAGFRREIFSRYSHPDGPVQNTSETLPRVIYNRGHLVITIQLRWICTRRRQRRASGMITGVESLRGYPKVGRAIEEKEQGSPRKQKASWDENSEVWSCFLTRRVQTSHWAGLKVGLDEATHHGVLSIPCPTGLVSFYLGYSKIAPCI